MRNVAQRIGVFGGTFDPPHVGHLIIAEQAREQLRLDKVLFIPAYLPPHKKNGASASPTQRLKMLQKAVGARSGFIVESLEVERKGTSYTVDTLKELKTRFKKARFFLIVGGDNYVQFRQWKSSDEIRRLATLVVYGRGGLGFNRRARHDRSVVFLRGGFLDVSSTLVRKKIREGGSIRFLVPLPVERYIVRNELYRSLGLAQRIRA